MLESMRAGSDGDKLIFQFNFDFSIDIFPKLDHSAGVITVDVPQSIE